MWAHHLQRGKLKSGAIQVGWQAREPVKKPRLLCEVERYQLKIVGLTTMQGLGSETLFLLQSCPGREISGRGGDTHKPPAKCLSFEVTSDEQEGDLFATSVCKRDGSDCCLCLFTKQQSRLPCFLEVSGWYSGKGAIWGSSGAPTTLQCPCEHYLEGCDREE
ncbi:hypothetical protein AMECASPLE_031228 [Ameca splendens]|uniref:Uncharacterized protein n=1 Tax=Ameca splendens TaxID=208324 RepID=A0ABV1ADI3_9TELE